MNYIIYTNTMVNFVSVHLMGGLGNQLFQIFTAIAYGMRHTRKVVFPYNDKLSTGIIRDTYWNNFLSALKQMTTLNEKNEYGNDALSKFPMYKEYSFIYNDIPNFNGHKEVMLYGYFQSYKYFEVEKTTIFSLLRLRKFQDSMVHEYPDLLKDNFHKVSMHFRLGDYKEIQECHPLMPYDYYQHALHYINTMHIDKKMKVLYLCQAEDNIVVSEIIDRLKQEFPHIFFIKVCDTIPDWKQMLIMSCCQDNIIANSTFSWWGGYFNDKPNRIVCYPSKWFGPKLSSHDTSELFPLTWTKIEV